MARTRRALWMSGVAALGLAALAWRFAWPPLNAWLGRFDDPVLVAPMDLDGDGADEAVVLYARSGEDDLAVAYDPRSGERIWEVSLPYHAHSAQTWGRAEGVAFLPVIVDDNQAIVGLDPATGAERWVSSLSQPAVWAVGCGATVFAGGAELIALDAADGQARDLEGVSRTGEFPSIACGADGARLLDSALGGSAHLLDGAGRLLNSTPEAAMVYTRDGATQILTVGDSAWAEGSVYTDAPPRTLGLATWVRPNGGFVSISLFYVVACDGASPRRCTSIDPGGLSPLVWLALPNTGGGPSRAHFTTGRYEPIPCRDDAGQYGICVLDLDEPRVVDGALGSLGLADPLEAVFAVGDSLRVLHVRELTGGAEALAVYDTRVGQITHITTLQGPAGPLRPGELTVGGGGVFGTTFGGDTQYVFQYDAAANAVLWSNPPGVVAADAPELRALLPSVD